MSEEMLPLNTIVHLGTNKQMQIFLWIPILISFLFIIYDSKHEK